MTNDELMSNDEAPNDPGDLVSPLGFRHSFVIGHSSFVILRGCSRFRRSSSSFPQAVDNRLHPLFHLKQLWPGAVIIFARQFAGGIDPHVRSDILFGWRVVE